MKAKSVKTKIKRLLKSTGSRQELADMLDIHISYIYKLERGFVPGGRLYRDILDIFGKIVRGK